MMQICAVLNVFIVLVGSHLVRSKIPSCNNKPEVIHLIIISWFWGLPRNCWNPKKSLPGVSKGRCHLPPWKEGPKVGKAWQWWWKIPKNMAGHFLGMAIWDAFGEMGPPRFWWLQVLSALRSSNVTSLSLVHHETTAGVTRQQKTEQQWCWT